MKAAVSIGRLMYNRLQHFVLKNCKSEDYSKKRDTKKGLDEPFMN